MKWEIEWQLFNDHGLENNGTDFVEGKNEKDAIKNWIYGNIDKILHKSFMEDWEGYKFKIENIRKAVEIKKRPKGVM